MVSVFSEVLSFQVLLRKYYVSDTSLSDALRGSKYVVPQPRGTMPPQFFFSSSTGWICCYSCNYHLPQSFWSTSFWVRTKCSIIAQLCNSILMALFHRNLNNKRLFQNQTEPKEIRRHLVVTLSHNIQQNVINTQHSVLINHLDSHTHEGERGQHSQKSFLSIF